MTSKFLLSHVSIHWPNFIVITCIHILNIICRLQLLLFFSNDVFDDVHWEQIDIIKSCPSILIHLASYKLFLEILIWSLDNLQQLREPVVNQLASFLRSYEIVFVPKLPRYFRIYLLTYSPVKRTAVMRIKKHENFGFLSIAIKYKIGGLLCYVHQPIKIFKKNVWEIHVYSSMSGYKG
jgi:hypothetical protein